MTDNQIAIVTVVVLLLGLGLFAGRIWVATEAGQAVNEPQQETPEPGKPVFFDDRAWEHLGGCQEGYGPLTLELQPGAYTYYGDAFEIRGCVRIMAP